ncbi:MAG: sialate O-acetylesterase [Acidobacteria bacterium]|nr:sialate O-acetylesterase [Acidobacteriota bacterium]
MRIIPALACLALPLLAQTLQVQRGAADYQVFQRGPGNNASLHIEGSAAGAAGKAVEARIVSAGMTLPGFDWKAAGKATAAAFAADLVNVPTGGPYRLEFRVAGASAVTAVSNILIGDLWILGGQSNMEGVGNLVNTPLPSAKVNSLDMTDAWVAAEDPLHRLVDSADRVHWRKNKEGELVRMQGEELAKWIANRKKGAGLGLPFALEMVRRTGVPVGLIPCAHGGTSMDQWSPDLKDKGGDSLYGGMVRRHALAGGKVKGLLWYQGESDASDKASPVFEQKFLDLIKAVRKDFNQPDLPFYYVQIGRHIANTGLAPWNFVQNAQLHAETQLPNLWMTGCADCDLDDTIHVGTDYNLILGRRLANLALNEIQRGPRPVAARLKGSVIEVEFTSVNGKLAHEGRLTGFVVVDAKGAPQPHIFRQRVSATNPNVVELLFYGKLPEGAAIQHGYGRDPYVNLRDSANMPAPIFGPLAIQ